MTYEELLTAMQQHVDEWHSTDDNGVRGCDYDSTCPLDGYQT